MTVLARYPDWPATVRVRDEQATQELVWNGLAHLVHLGFTYEQVQRLLVIKRARRERLAGRR